MLINAVLVILPFRSSFSNCYTSLSNNGYDIQTQISSPNMSYADASKTPNSSACGVSVFSPVHNARSMGDVIVAHTYGQIDLEYTDILSNGYQVSPRTEIVVTPSTFAELTSAG